ncbi:uncharacterized protein MYCGRDRAFT_97636 [Zymoseptoria tritici IPO323]|uniref:Uncharacterized protein n=1 Tax=Zymoseptoria tritici (strain CBS 115943 / IPO323) TaxID=336722 RepID=F9XR29_ZYMTI|nr:uncharacterized protein MYCGRDRAFT_97636 [Zymoseptoria tritici IPO323]EGP82361.1 hypothetical protein MYCGRDRAFT_97636 [Zymoseptoria tritici IPO323]
MEPSQRPGRIGHGPEEYDRHEYNHRSGHDRSGFDRYEYDRYVYNRSGPDRSGYDSGGWRKVHLVLLLLLLLKRRGLQNHHARKSLEPLLLLGILIIALIPNPESLRRNPSITKALPRRSGRTKNLASTCQSTPKLISKKSPRPSALKELKNTASLHAEARLSACLLMDVSAELYSESYSHALLARAWEAPPYGWGCPVPQWLKSPEIYPRFKTTFDEKLGYLGVEAAGQMWNITILLLQSSSAFLAVAQKAAHAAAQIQQDALNSKVCHNSYARTFLWPTATPTGPAPLELLNTRLSMFKSTLAVFVASQSLILAQLPVSIDIFRYRFDTASTPGRNMRLDTAPATSSASPKQPGVDDDWTDEDIGTYDEVDEDTNNSGSNRQLPDTLP